MKKFFKVVIPIILVFAIIACIGWYLLIYDRDFTRDMLLNSARYFDDRGNHTISGWFYDQLNTVKVPDFFAGTQIQYRRNWDRYKLTFRKEVEHVL